MTLVKHHKSCARCAKQLPADKQRRLFSAHTRLYYCVDIDACGRRAKRRAKADA